MQTKYLFATVLGGFLAVAYFGPDIKTWIASAGSDGGYSSAVNVVSEGPRCDNTLHTIQIGEGFQPIHAGCMVEWGINDNSTSPCVFLVDAQQQIISQAACRGNEASFAGIPITGWQSVDGFTLIDVVYKP
ncbi:MAG: hypothetical protein G01um101456_91 [Parcubacteria group bacterium Gr01-1014_56]|nr:MAG: hypothetical protein G01um101456_91 [Parcubacteria group bacterium Gr01-1014_56]